MRLARFARSALLTLSLLGLGAAAGQAKPKINFSTFLGGPGLDASVGIAVDAARRSYVLSSTDNPERFAGSPTLLGPGGERDMVITRLDKRGGHEQSVVLGGSDFDQPLAIAVGPDPHGVNPSLVYVLGFSISADFPILDPVQAECAGKSDCPGNLTITVLDADLEEILFSTYLGGADGEVAFLFDRAGDLAVDGDGRIAIASSTLSKKGYPTRRPTQKKSKGDSSAVVSVLQPFPGGGFRLVFSTYLGGLAKKTDSFAHGVAFGSDGLLYVVGSTDDRRFPGMAPLQEGIGGERDGFLTVYDLDGADPRIVHSTMLGGRDADWFFDVAVEKHRIYVAGTSGSPDFPLTNPFQPGLRGESDALLAVFDIGPTLSSGAPPSVVVSTLFGGRQHEVGYALGVDRKGIVHLVGHTFSHDLPVRSPVQAQCAPDPSNVGCWDGFVARFEPIENGAPPELRFGTFLGGAGSRSGGVAGADILTDVAVDNKGATYVVGRTDSPGYPTRRAVQKRHGGGIVDGCVTNIKK